jgi:hypothetical protein
MVRHYKPVPNACPKTTSFPGLKPINLVLESPGNEVDNHNRKNVEETATAIAIFFYKLSHK